MKHILITGGKGYIAKELHSSFKHDYHVTTISRDTFDLSNAQQTKLWFQDKYFDVVIHTAIRGGSRLVKDDSVVLDNNLQMYFNLLDQQLKYSRFINIGSGAELYSTNSPYGLSKHVIRTSLLEKNNFYNLRIFGIFNENELETRFIKANITKYVRKEPMLIFEDKLMDFYYMNDFVSLIRFYVENDNVPKEYDCCYEKHLTLSMIAEKINSLSTHKVPVLLSRNEPADSSYMGTYTPLPISTVGLDVGIQNVYEKLSCKI